MLQRSALVCPAMEAGQNIKTRPTATTARRATRGLRRLGIWLLCCIVENLILRVVVEASYRTRCFPEFFPQLSKM
jgi:hypothetical protein